MTTVGARLRELRRRAGLTQVQLAGADFCVSYVSAVERDKIEPSLARLRLMAERLGVPVVRLLEGDPSAGSPRWPSGQAGQAPAAARVEGEAASGDPPAGAASPSLAEWVDRELVRRGWRRADLAYRARVSPAELSHVLSGERGPTARRCLEIAQALDAPPETVFRLAGWLPPASPNQAEAEELLHSFQRLGVRERRLLVATARAWASAADQG